MKTLHQKLHLQHHRHSGRLLHRRHTSYRGLALIVVVGSAFVVGLNMMASATAATFSQADNILVSARNPAPIPPTAAIILTPLSPYNTASPSVTVTGTCPVITPNVLIVIEDNGYPSSSVPCDAANHFSVSVPLTPGTHSLIAQIYTITDDQGPPSNTVIVTYSPPAPTTTTPSPGTTTRPSRPSMPVDSTSPLTFKSRTPYIVFGPARDAIWQMTIVGGKSPYSLQFDWGDGTMRSYTSDLSEKTYRHNYATMRPYTVIVTIRDASGQTIQLNIAAVTPYVPPAAPYTTGGTSPYDINNLLGLYGAYLLLIVGVTYLAIRNPHFIPLRQPVPVLIRRTNNKGKATRRRL